MANVKHFNLLLLLQNSINHTIHVGLTVVEEVPELLLLWRHWAPVRELFKAENGIFEPCVPSGSGAGILGVDLFEQGGEVAHGTSGYVNEIGHGRLRTR
jgi:hypothetical protein